MAKVTAHDAKPKEVKKDDFAHFFYDATPEEKAAVIERVMQKATAEQEKVLKEYRKKTV
jgi:hypothetical protein